MMPDPIDLSSLASLFNVKARQSAIKKMVGNRANRVMVVDGLAGSSSSMLFTALPQLDRPYLIVVNDLDEAGYVYNDLCQLASENQVLLFPSGYKRDIKYGQVDAPQEILRTEVLNRWHTDNCVKWVVTYPEALVSGEYEGTTTVQFVVGSDGEISEVSVFTSSGYPEMDDEAVRVVQNFPNWTPAKKNGEAFAMKTQIPIHFAYYGDDED